MDCVHIRGKKPLAGEVWVQGSKNAALPILTATLLIPGKTVLHHCPQITDIDAMLALLSALGCKVKQDGNTITVDARTFHNTCCPRKHVKAMRSSLMLLGPLLGRCRRAVIYRPGGCVIGERPVNLHEEALKQMHVSFREEEDCMIAETDELKGADVTLSFPSVGATENIVMAAVLAKGTTRLSGAAREPEICQLCQFLISAGAHIRGVGTSELEIEGVDSLHETTVTIRPDRIVAGTYLLAGVATRGTLLLRNAPTGQLTDLIALLRQMGAFLFADHDLIYLDGEKASRPVPYIETAVYPGFPTDLQSILVSVLASAQGESCVRETIFEDRFKIVPELVKMGADIQVKNRTVCIRGTDCLKGAALQAQELRGGAALIVAALSARGDSTVRGYEFIRRGYEDIVRDFRCLGADICLEDEDP